MLGKKQNTFKRECGIIGKKWSLEPEKPGTKYCSCYFWALLPNIIPEFSSSKHSNRKESVNAIPTFLPNRHQVFSLPSFVNLESGPTSSWAFHHWSSPLDPPFQTKQRTFFPLAALSSPSFPAYFQLYFLPTEATWGNLGEWKEEAVMEKMCAFSSKSVSSSIICKYLTKYYSGKGTNIYWVSAIYKELC